MSVVPEHQWPCPSAGGRTADGIQRPPRRPARARRAGAREEER